ncbi:UbiA prenyltransferase family protein [Bernardetia litoralis DSM 6794]|uniref:UbiA prenyltransferase family protein n=1 Tax=Bernardetia litoralis (strain ATCC 23117 / DSM 6794 / NBRC 15988 / NCIMB 1366 / Fx l1 / Sio-4) TaxID=880071 RepID=I4ANC5_BERLS|nr:UbiA family prenyltransferase [Bernardetia litoralis]AFM05460.1 UbiA prenyltransferase family protein [Bernardetia litoralis DSM 6794]
MGLSSYLLLFETAGISFEIAPLWILFFGTLVTYNLCVFYTAGTASKKFEFIYKKRNSLKIIFFLSLILLIPAPFFLTLNQFWFLVHLAVISIFYTVPIHIELPSDDILEEEINGKQKTKKSTKKNYFAVPAWRNIPYLKIFLIAYVWASATVIFPMLHEHLIIQNPKTIALFFERLFFTLAITVPFDIRDKEGDKRVGLNTLVSLLSVQKSKILAIFLLLICTALIYHFHINYFLHFGIVYILTAFLIIGSSNKRSEWYFTGLIDGLFVVEFLILFFI